MGVEFMTKSKAIYEFFNSFDIPAYPNTSVPKDAVMPYITYDYQESDFLSDPVSLSVNVWYRTESESIPNAKVEEISQVISLGGKQIICDTGVIWIRKGSPWSSNIQDADDDTVKRRLLNVTLEFLTV